MYRRAHKLLSIFLAITLMSGQLGGLFGGPPKALADEGLWNTTKSYTGALKDAAEVAAAAVAAAAAADVAAAQAAVAAAAGNPATTAATLAALASAEAALATATTALAVATKAATIAAAILAAATVGTLIGQGVNFGWSWCWDPHCDLTVVNTADIIYRPATTQEVDALIPELIFMGTGMEMSKADFEAAGASGMQAWDFMARGAKMFIDVTRGAAAFSNGHDAEVAVAINNFQTELKEYAVTINTFASTLENTSLLNPTTSVQNQRERFDVALQTALETLDSKSSGYEEARSQLMQAAKSYAAGQTKLEQASFPPLVGSKGAFPDFTLSKFKAFLADCAERGAPCLPPAEITIADRLLSAAGVHSPTQTSLGPAIAKWDAEGDIGGKEAAMFGSSGVLNLAQLLQKSTATSVAANGPWLNIDLNQSPITQGIAARVPRPQSPSTNLKLPNLGPVNLSWTNAQGVTQVQVQVVPLNNDGPGINLIFGSPVVNYQVQSPVFGSGPYVILPGSTYTWRTRSTMANVAISENDPRWSLWSEARTFTTAPPNASSIQLQSPISGQVVTDSTPTVQWYDSNTQTFYYEVQVSTDPTFGQEGPKAAVFWNLVHGGQTNPLNSWTVPQGFFLAQGTYYWRLRQRVQATPLGIAEPGIAWSAAASFTINASARPTLTVAIGPSTAAGQVVSAPAGINCPLGICFAQFDTGTAVALTATAEVGWRFKEWRGDCTGTSAAASVILDFSRVCDAIFEPVG